MSDRIAALGNQKALLLIETQSEKNGRLCTSKSRGKGNSRDGVFVAPCCDVGCPSV